MDCAPETSIIRPSSSELGGKAPGRKASKGMNDKAPGRKASKGMGEQYPEHGKLLKVAEHSQAIGEFLAWLSEDQQVCLAKNDVKVDNCRNCDHPDTHDYRPPHSAWAQCAHTEHEDGTCDHGSECEHFGECKCDSADFGNPERLYSWPHKISDLLATYFKIDLMVLENEKRAMLDDMRALNDVAK